MARRRLEHAVRGALAAVAAVALVAGLAPPLCGPLAAQAAASASNPRVVEDSSMESGQRATWDCVWFGSYPQTEVTSGDPAYASLANASWNSNGDAVVGGTKYRRISKNDATYSNYWPTGSAYYRYFRYEPIKWRVLNVSGSTAFVVADQGLDGRRYNENYVNVTWATSSVRSWLNGYGASSNESGNDYSGSSFVSTAFSAGERSAILTTDVVNADNVLYGTDGGVDTKDKVFLLSESEVYGDAATVHGYASDWTIRDGSRRAIATGFANAMGAWVASEGDYSGNCRWWLRSPGSNADCAACVWDETWVNRQGSYTISILAVRPALKLNLASSCPTGAGTVSSDGTADEKAPTGQYGSDTTGDSGGGSSSGSDSSSGSVAAKSAAVGGVVYKVTGKGAVASKAAKASLRKVTVPAAVKIGGRAYKVTGIAAKAFAGCKKLAKVVVGKNVLKVGAGAFSGCKKLKAVTVKSSLLKKKASVKGMLSGCKAKKVAFKVPKKLKKAYKKVLTKKNLKASGKVVVK